MTKINECISDGRAAIQPAIQDYITENTDYASIAMNILDA
jgi:hypothetical protein